MDDQRHDKTCDPVRFFDAAPAIMVVMDRDRRITDVNRRFCELFGAVTADLCHVALKRRPGPCDRCPVAAAFADGQPHWSEETLVTHAGPPLVVMTWAAPLCDTQGRVCRVLRVSTDISPLARGTVNAGTALPADRVHGWRGLITALDGGLYQLERAADGGRWDQIQTSLAQVRHCVGRLRGFMLDLLEGRRNSG